MNIADNLKDLPLRILSTSLLEQVHYFRGEYERVVDLRGLPGDWAHEPVGNSVSTTVFDRIWLVNSFAELGRFTRAAEHVAGMIRLAEPTQQTSRLSMTYFAAGVLLLSLGHWAKAAFSLSRVLPRH